MEKYVMYGDKTRAMISFTR